MPNYPVKDLKTFQYSNVLSCLPRVYCTGKDLLVKNTNKGEITVLQAGYL